MLPASTNAAVFLYIIKNELQVITNLKYTIQHKFEHYRRILEPIISLLLDAYHPLVISKSLSLNRSNSANSV